MTHLDSGSLGDIDNQSHVGVVVVVGAARNFFELVSHADELGIGL